MTDSEHALAAARRQLSAFRDVATAVGSRLELGALLDAIVHAVCSVVGCERASLFLLDEHTGELVSRVVTDHDAEIRLAKGEGIAGAVVAHGTSMRLADAWVDPRFHRTVDENTGFRTRTLLAVPLRDRDGVIKGVVEALNKHHGAFDDDDEQLLDALGAEIAVSLQRALLFDELSRKKAEADRRVQELDLLVEIDRAMLAVDGVQALLDVVVERTSALLPAVAASIAVLNPRTSALVYRAATGPGEDVILARAIPSDLGFAGVAFSERRAVRVDDASADERHAARVAKSTAFEPGPMLVVPLLVPRTKGGGDDEERVLGVLSALRARGDASFTASDERLLTLIAHRVAFAVDEEERKERARTREQLETMGRMLAGIVHDFKTPMTVISGYVQLMAAEEDPAERQACANQVLKSTEQMSSMIKQLLSFARGDSGALLRKMWMETLVRDATDTLQRVVGSSGVELVVDVRSKAALRADDLKIKRALVNLVKNAREALTQTPPAAPQKARITVAVADDGDHICLSVADNGPGLSPQIETRLFQEFATWGKTEGTGLGLALVKRIAEEHGGGVLVDNRPGEGCTFTLRLPRA